ncbi:MAG: dTDP-4-dehydrorhamnose 3,5-epimerase [Lentimicrobium sp.]
MELRKRKFQGVYEIALKPHIDERGFFMRTFDVNLFQHEGLNFSWVQENHSRSERRGIVRGLHFQFPPFSETKLVRCISGAILDVFVDLRAGSETFGSWDSIELSAQNKRMILIPRGFAHGFFTLTDISEVVYKVDNFYSKENESGLKWNDGELKIKWPEAEVIVSDKDSCNMSFREFVEKYKAIKV